MKVTHLVALALILPACNQPKTATTPKGAVSKSTYQPADPVKQSNDGTASNASLVGTWVKCNEMSDGEDVRSSYETLVFNYAKNVNVDVKYYSDTKCKIPFSQSTADAELKNYKDLEPSDLAEMKKYFDLLVKGAKSLATYTASAISAAGYGAFDVVVPDVENSFLAYKIVGNQLFISEPCYEEDGEPEPVPDDFGPYELTKNVKFKSHSLLPKPKFKAQSALKLDSVQIPDDDEVEKKSNTCGKSAADRSISFQGIAPYIKQ